MTQIQLLPSETAWVVRLLAIGLVFAVLVTLVVLRLVHRPAEPADTDELRSRVESLETAVEALPASSSNEQSRPDLTGVDRSEVTESDQSETSSE